MKVYISLFFYSLFFYHFSIGQSIQPPSNCIQLDIEVLSIPFCQGSFNGGQLQVNVQGGSGFYSYEWKDDNGGDPPGGPQVDLVTLSFLTVGQTYWVFVYDQIQDCLDSASFIFTDYACQQDTAKIEIEAPFDLNPVGYSEYSECKVKLTNLGCQLNFKPEFIISHPTENLDLNYFEVQFFNSLSDEWETIPYSINNDGDAIGYWGSQSGETISCDDMQVRKVRVKFNQFNPTAPTGVYSAILRLWSVDQNGDLLSIISDQQQISLNLIDTICNELNINSIVTDATCAGVFNGQIDLSAEGGDSPYLFSLNNSVYSSIDVFSNLTNGVYYFSVKDVNNCQNSDTIYLNPAPVLPDTLWFDNILPFSADIFWPSDSLADGYKFRFRELGQAWQGPIGSGLYTNNIAEMLPSKTISGLSPATVYEVQVKANSITDCEEGWSTEIYRFTTPIEVYVYNVDNTCPGESTGQIYFNIISNNNYTFLWQGPNGFLSTDTSIYQLPIGDYNLQISNEQSSVIFDTTFNISNSNITIGLTMNNDPSLILYSEQEQLYFAQTCNLSSYLIAEDGFTDYIWNYGDSLQYIQGQQLLIDTSNIFVQVEALDSNNCISKSDSVHVSITSDFVNLMQANTDEDYIQSTYVLCSADSTVNIDISPFITGNYSIEWRQVIGQNTTVLSNNPQIELIPYENTNYQLNISNCTFDFHINFFPSPAIDLQHTNLLCYGDTNAQVIISTDSSAFINYTLYDSTSQIVYQYESSSHIDTVKNLSAGSYLVELKDEFLCVVQDEFEVLQPDSIYFDSLNIQNIDCFGEGLGSMSFKVYGGVNPDNFVLNGDTILLVSDQNGYYYLDGLIPSAYILEVKDLNGCFHTLNFDIKEAALLSLSVVDFVDTINCFSDSNAYISLSSNGGTPFFIYDLYTNDTLHTQQSSSIFNNLSAGNYEIFVTDYNNCKDSTLITISENPQLNIFENLNLHQDILCNGDSLGFTSLTIEGGNFYSNDTSFIINNDSLKAGYYSYSITDSLGCSITIDSIQVTEPTKLTLSLNSIQDIDCELSNGSASFSIQGGILPYEYSLNGGNEIEVIDGLPLSFANLDEGGYSLTIIDSNSCEDSLFFNIQDLSNFSLSILNISDTLSCFGDSSGFIEVGVGVTGNYQFSLFSDNLTLPLQQSSYFGNLVAGQYGIFAIDEFDCVDSLLFEIIENPLLMISENLDLHQDVLCDGSALGSITNIITGGEAPYTIEIIGDVVHNYPHQFNNLYVGQYDFLATDVNGCTDELTVEILTNPISPELLLVSSEPVDCEGLGSATIELVNGSEPFYFKLDGTNIQVTLDSQNQFSFTELEDNSYQLTIVDDFLCVDTLNFDISNVSNVLFEIVNSYDTLDCYMDSTGFVEFGVQNGTLPYTFELIKDGDTLATQSSNIFNNLRVGDYLATLNDGASCHQELNFSIRSDKVFISDSLEFHKDVSCFGINDGEFMLNIDSKFSSFLVRLIDTTNTIIYPWENQPHLFTNLTGGIYNIEIVQSLSDDCPYYFEVEILEPDSFVLDSFLITDVLCNGDSSGLFEPYISGGTPQYKLLFNNDSLITSSTLYAASYNVQISDSNNCTIDTNFIVNQPNELSLSTIDNLTFNVSCFANNNGQIGIEAVGGVPPYKFKINNGALQDSNVFEELIADTFLISVVDSIGCEDTLTVIITQPDLSLFIDSYELSDSLGYCALCYGDSSGFIDIILTGGTPAYEFYIVNHPDTFTSSRIEKLVGGQEYEFFAKDALGCLTDTIKLECTSPDELILSLDTATLPSCCYTCDSEVYLKSEGGISPYSYGFQNGIFQSDSLFNQLCGDSTYSFKILDSFGCEKNDSSLVVPNRECLTVDTVNYITLGEPALIHYDICQVNGSAKIFTTAQEGVGNYSFSIDFQDFIQENQIMFDSLHEGPHTLLVKDELNCVDTLNFLVSDSDPIVISELTIDTIFCGAPTINSNTGQSDVGYINAVASGGSSGIYFYSLDVDSTLYQTSGEFNALDSGFYSMNIIDLNNCIQEFDIYIPYYSSSIDYTVNDISCPGFNDGFVEIDSVYGEMSPWVTLDGNTSNSNIYTALQAGIHDLSVYYFRPDNTATCNYSESFEIMGKEDLNFSCKTFNSSCNSVCDGLISVESFTGGTLPYNFICINTNDTSMNYNDLCANEYAVKMMDNNGCFTIKNITITEPNSIYPVIDYVDGDLIILEPTSSNPLSGIPPYSYQWYDTNGEIVGANGSFFKPSLPGIYNVIVTDSTDCVGESSRYKIEVLGLNNWGSETVDVFPNPFSQSLNIKTYSDKLINWTISDVSGRLILSGNSKKSWSVNTTELLNGIYFLRLNKEGGQLIYKIIKQ